MRKIFLILFFLIASIAVMRGQEIEGTAPISIDRAMSVWARDRVNINFDSIYHRAGDSTWVSITATTGNITTVNADDFAGGDIDVDSISTDAVYYADTYYDDLRVAASNTRINPANSEPDYEDPGDGFLAWGFNADSDSSWVLNFECQLPHRRAYGTDLDAHVHWQPDGTNTGNVVWKLAYVISNVNGSWVTADTLRVVDAGDGVALKHQLADLGDIEGDTMKISAMIKGNIGRMGDATDDTYTGSAYLLEIDFHYQIDSPGSRDEYTK